VNKPPRTKIIHDCEPGVTRAVKWWSGHHVQGNKMHPSEQTKRAAFLTDRSRTIMSWSPACEALFGAAAPRMIGQPLYTLLAEESEREWSAHWLSEADVAITTHYVRIVRADGRIIAAELEPQPQFNERGEWTGCVVHFSTTLGGVDSAAIGSIPLRDIINLLPGAFYVMRPDTSFAIWNKTLEKVVGRNATDMLDAHGIDMFDLTDRRLVESKVRQIFETGAQVFVEATLIDRAARGTPYLLCGTRIECMGKPYLCGMGFDISHRFEQEQKLLLRDRALHAASNGIVITRIAGRESPIEYVNPAFERITGYRLDEVVGRDSRFMAAPGVDLNERAELRRAIDERREVHVTFRNLRKNGEIFWNDLTITPVTDTRGQISHYIGVINDVTASKQRTALLEHEVNHDALTGLANRTLMWDRLEQAIHLAQRNKSLVATVLTDLNGFKLINDTFGHEAGDAVLVAVAKRLQASVRESDTVARLSGDEFVLVLTNQPSLRYTLRMIERLRQSMMRPVSFKGQEIAVGASLGVSVYPHDGESAFELVRAADVAMYHAKATKRNEVHFFSPDMKTSTEAKLQLESNMRTAVENKQLFLVFQPRICLGSARILGFEALLRWRHPQQGVLLPSSFLAEAEENGMIIPFGNTVLELACAFLQRMRQCGYPDLPVSVNVSQREFLAPHYVEHLAEILNRNDIAPELVEIELREESLIRNYGKGRDLLMQLNELGVLRSVDAFGNGLSDLNYLQKLPLSHIKMAKLAVHQISAETRSGPMAKTLIDISHNLNVRVVADCVETRAQMEFLRGHHCDEMQGLYFREPLPIEAIEELMVTGAEI
jgi:diguanylate cyclase (GGDEF)-like protein/PAS domain S-box-containing protein